jgi:energy-coupling factor transporter ATP-binding protein EcfA2
MSAALQLVGGTPLTTVTAQDLVAEKLGEVEWVIPSFIPAGGFTVLYGAPKSGKTTLAMHMAAAIVGSRVFLGGHSNLAEPVILLDLEQSRRVTQRRMIEVGAHQAFEHLHIWSGRPPALADLLATIEKIKPPVVFVDSLSRWLLLEQENDNAELTRRLGPIVAAFQERDVALVVIHHDRKSEGDSGRNMRGASALLAMCDVAIEVRKEKENDAFTDLRKLTIVSRLEPERILSVRLTAEGFVEEASPAERQEARILEQLVAGPQAIATLHEVLGLDDEALRKRLGALMQHGRVTKSGRGVRGDPHIFTVSPILRNSPKSTAGETPAGFFYSPPPVREDRRIGESGKPKSAPNGKRGAGESDEGAGTLAQMRL